MPELCRACRLHACEGLTLACVQARNLYGRNELPPEKGEHGTLAARLQCVCVNVQCCAGVPFWRLVLKQFDDLLVKVSEQSSLTARSLLWTVAADVDTCVLQVLLAAAVVDFVIALLSGETGAR